MLSIGRVRSGPWPSLGAACLVALTSVSAAFADTRDVELAHQTVHVLVQTPVGTQASVVVVVASGAAGWRGLTSDVGDRLSAAGYAVVGLDTRSYLIEGTRLFGALAPADLGDDYLAVLRSVRGWFPDVQFVYLLGVSEGAGLAVVAAADPRVGTQLTGLVGLETPRAVSLRSPYWTWTTWITHRDADEASVLTGDYLAAVAPVPVTFIDAPCEPGGRCASAHATFDRGGEPRRWAVIDTGGPPVDGTQDRLVDALRRSFEWSVAVSRSSDPDAPAVGGPAARSLR